MAQALPGTHPQGTPRLRILLCICELQQAGAPATFRQMQRKLRFSAGSMTHHLRVLEDEALVRSADETRAFTLTNRALSGLLQDGWLTTSHMVSLLLSTQALELLELAPPADEEVERDAEPRPASEEG